MVSGGASESEAAAIVAALEQFLADTAPAAQAPQLPLSAWQRTALEESISARQINPFGWGSRRG